MADNLTYNTQEPYTYVNWKIKRRKKIFKATALRKEPVGRESAMKERNMINTEINFGFENKDFSEAKLYTFYFSPVFGTRYFKYAY